MMNEQATQVNPTRIKAEPAYVLFIYHIKVILRPSGIVVAGQAFPAAQGIRDCYAGHPVNVGCNLSLVYLVGSHSYGSVSMAKRSCGCSRRAFGIVEAASTIATSLS